MLDNIVQQTNLYASQYADTHTITPRSRVQQWSRQEFDRDELKKFLALVIIMGLVNLPTMEDHSRRYAFKTVMFTEPIHKMQPTHINLLVDHEA